jgi:hypothetical protein
MNEDRIREQLEALGREPAPPDVVERLDRVLAAEPEPVTHRRVRPYRRVLALAAPLAVAAGISVVIVGMRHDSDHRSTPTSKTPAADVEMAPSAPPPAGASAAAGSAGASAAATPAPSFGADQAVNPARAAAIDSYRAVERAVRQREHGVP